MKIKLESWTWLPRLGTDAFRELMRIGVKYEKKRGFYIPAAVDLQSVANIIGSATGKPVIFIFNCYICGKETDCLECEYKWACRIETTSGRCICSECARSSDIKKYFSRFSTS